MKVVLTTVVCLAVLAFASSVQAAQRYAAPEGNGPEPCAQGAPCSLKEALFGAKDADEVIVGAGSYTVSAPISATGKALYVHGDFGGPLPKINASVVGPPFNFSQPEQHIAYLEIVNTTGESAYGFVCGKGWRIERVRILALSAANSYGVFAAEGCLVRDSFIRAQGTNASGFFHGASMGPAAVARNLTVVASGAGSMGVLVANSGTAALDVKNSILAGDAADVKIITQAKAFIGNSNFDSPQVAPEGQLIDLGGNQSAAPQFVDAAKADYREVAGSPTIDAGVDDQLGTLDLDGKARVVGSAVDIGAYEFVPAPATTTPAAGQIQSLALSPSTFAASKSGDAIVSAKKKAKAPVGTAVTYSLSAAGSVAFTVERKLVGRKAGKKCVAKTKANAGKKKCGLFKPVKGGFTHSGVAGANSFKFSGRVGGKALAPGSYRLIGSTGDVEKAANFKIVK